MEETKNSKLDRIENILLDLDNTLIGLKNDVKK